MCLEMAVSSLEYFSCIRCIKLVKQMLRHPCPIGQSLRRQISDKSVRLRASRDYCLVSLKAHDHPHHLLLLRGINAIYKNPAKCQHKWD
jgi:hypothetical protein